MVEEAKRVRSTPLPQLKVYNEQLQTYAFAARNKLINTWKRSAG